MLAASSESRISWDSTPNKEFFILCKSEKIASSLNGKLMASSNDRALFLLLIYTEPELILLKPILRIPEKVIRSNPTSQQLS
jgi:hypothetical protein